MGAPPWWAGGFVLLPLLLLLTCLSAMRLDPERIATRLRIEREIELDKLEALESVNSSISRKRGIRQALGQPKEISIQVTAPLFSSRLYEYGIAAGDVQLPKSLDIGQRIDLTNPIVFFGEEFLTLYILSNGGIGFDQSSRTYKASVLPSEGLKLIAPFWNRNDLRNGGNVYYREVTKGRVLERGQAEIRFQYDKNLKVVSALLVTWEKMQPVGAAALPDENTNTFQAAIFVTENGTFANFIYSNIGWTQGAEAGFNKGDGKTHFALHTSGTGNIMFLEEYGNTGIPGEWMFEFSQNKIIRCKAGIKGNTCDEECGKGEFGVDCEGCCRCTELGACHPVTGECQKGGCTTCWIGSNCQTRSPECKSQKSSNKKCAPNALSFEDYDRCGEPSQRCRCLSGFQGDGYKMCKDIDECAQPRTCHPNAVCTNTPGKFFCSCKSGYSGDGIKECSLSFLLPNENHHILPKARAARLDWQLKHPLNIFGKVQDKITLSTTGLIGISELPNDMKSLSEMSGIEAIAPFYADIDMDRGSGKMTVKEITGNETLDRLTRSINTQYGDTDFLAQSAVIVTLDNVTNGQTSTKGNNLQTVLIGGVDSQQKPKTFVQLLYKDVPWGDTAESGILSGEAQSSILLPGSGTAGMSQLATLSNVKQPGVWIYRIDESSVHSCPKESLAPPYCDHLQPATTTQKYISNRLPDARANLNEKSESLMLPPDFDFPRTIKPTFVEKPKGQAGNARPNAKNANRQKPRPQFGSTPHKPLVSLSDEDFEAIGPDAFEATFPPFVTVIPEIFVDDKKGSKKTQPLSRSRPLPDFSTDESSQKSTVSPIDRHATQPQHRQTTKTSAFTTTMQPTTESTFPTFSDSFEETTHRMHKMPSTRMPEPDPETIVVGKVEEQETLDSLEPITEEFITTTRAIQVLTISPKILRTKPTTAAPKKRLPPQIVTAATTPPVIATGDKQEHHAAKLAIIIPTGIVAVWLILLCLIASVVCCKKRTTEAQLREIYGPTYAVRPTAYNFKTRNPSNNMDPYEDHLEKAARLSSEMNAYGQNRTSLYGSYWNMNNHSPSSQPTGSSGSSGSGSGQRNGRNHSGGGPAPYTTGFNQNRYYSGRY
ncbi:hypothetical protein WR25_05596 [Diploscapter pachys]|uniref:EGF-like domain-containing protein n=1 Tax=Diploscapter pachys TaxID=2018661 RepID=A0A2A2LSY1_9BILA|nr:hypothetical protein WR25_05596 [Diploscapter pachys]